MEFPKDLSKLKLKKIRCEECVSFDRKTGVRCFLTNGKCTAKQEACRRVRVKEERWKSGPETTQDGSSE